MDCRYNMHFSFSQSSISEGQMPKNERTRPDLWAEREEARLAAKPADLVGMIYIPPNDIDRLQVG